MASRKIFGLHLFAFVLILFLRIEFNSSEELGRRKKSAILGKDTDPTRRSFSLIDRIRESEPGNEWQIVEDPEDSPRIRRSPLKIKIPKIKSPSRPTGITPAPKSQSTPNHVGIKPAPKADDITAFPGLERAKPKTPVQGGGGLRPRWKDEKGKIHEWDSKKGEVEVYDKRGKNHEGGYDPYDNPPRKVTNPDPSRKVEP